MSGRTVAVAACAALLSLPSTARAGTCLELGGPSWNGAAPIALGTTCDDLEAIAVGTTAEQVGWAMDDWSRLACAEIAFEPLVATATPLGVVDGTSTIGCVEEDWPYDDAAIGITLVEVGSCGLSSCIVESDTSLNAESFDWVTTRGALPEVNAYSIALHELGHALGLGHSNANGAAMGIGYARGYLVLGEDDQEGACELYPREGEPQDCADVGCPFGSECADGACVPSALESCVTAMDCARDERCIEATGLCVRQNVVVPGLGEPCETPADCESQECEDLDGEKRCTLTCDGLDPRSCPTGFFCDPARTAACGTGLCVAGDGGSGAFGTACEHATDCASLFCDRGACSLPCDPNETANCPAGRSCHPDAETGCGACHSPLALGEPCLVDTQCASSMCFAESAEEVGFCTTTCADPAECPAGFRCASAGDAMLCFPPEDAGGCGCAAAGAGPSPGRAAPAALGIALAGLLSARSRRRRNAPRDALDPGSGRASALANARIRPTHAP